MAASAARVMNNASPSKTSTRVNQEQQPDEGVGTRETDLTDVPQRQRGEGVKDGGGSVNCARPAFESSQIALVNPSAKTGAEAVYACARLRFKPCKTSRATVVIQRSSHAKVTPSYKAIRSCGERAVVKGRLSR